LRDGEGQALDYGFVKAIVFGAPLDQMNASLIRPSAIPDPLRDFFRRATYGQILKRIEDEERQAQSLIFLNAGEKTAFLRLLKGYRRLLVYEPLMDEAERRQERQFRWQVAFVATPPGKGEKEDKERSLEASALQIQVWTCPKQDAEEPRLLGEEVIPFEGDFFSKFEQAADRFLSGLFNQAVDRLLQTHCQMPELLRLRFRRAWWSKRPSPTGFAIVTGYLIPKLYDYLRPFYPVKPPRRRSGPGAYPQQLMRDIAEVLRLERPELCSALTPSRVRGVVERYLARAKPGRPMGEAMFRVRSRYTGREAIQESLASGGRVELV